MHKKLTALLCCAAVFLCSCSQGETIMPQRKTKLAPPFAPLTEIRAGRKNLYLIVKNLDSSYWQVMIEGAKEAGEAFDCNIYYSGTYSEADWDMQADLLNDCIKKKADAVLVAPDDSVKLSPSVSAVYQKGIPVVMVDTAANTDDYNVCFMTDNLLAGKNAAEEMMALMHRMGHTDNDSVEIGVMVSTTNSQTINERLAGFFQYWAENAPPNWSIIPDIKCFEGDTEMSVPYAEKLMEENPGITGLYGTNDGPTAGLAKALMENGRTDIGIVGFDYSDPIAELIASPDYAASTMLQQQYDMSYRGVETALELIEGKTMPIKFIDMGVITVNEQTIQTPEVQEVIAHN